jgi:flagellar motor switch protein FliN
MIMVDSIYKLVGDKQPNLTRDHVHFTNINLDEKALIDNITPIIDVICSRIESAYKSPAQISYTGSRILKDSFIDGMQFDDVCLKLLHIDSGLFLYITLGSRIARTLLIRLLSTTLIDDNSGLPFSATEKGLFSFIIARLIFDIKNSIGNIMPNCKIIGVYHHEDEALATVNTLGFGSYNFSLTFAHKSFPVTIALPPKAFALIKKNETGQTNLLPRCGHLCFPLIISLKKILLTQSALENLSFGDLIIFDNSEQTLHHKIVTGPVKALWHNIALFGMLSGIDGRYHFMPDQHHLSEDDNMEDLLISTPSDHENGEQPTNHQSQLANLAKNIRVPVSIELSRVPMTLREICAIKEGEIIDLYRKIDDPLEMVVEGKVIGYCQPVQIEGRLGIRVLQIVGEEQGEKN